MKCYSNFALNSASLNADIRRPGETMVLLYSLGGFLLVLTTGSIWLSDYSPGEVRAHWITALVTFVIFLLAFVASVRFGKHSPQTNSRFYGLVGVFGAIVLPFLIPAVLRQLGLSHHSFMVYLGAFVAGVIAALMAAMPITERIQRGRRVPDYWNASNGRL